MTAESAKHLLVGLDPVQQTRTLLEVLADDPAFQELAAAAQAELARRDEADSKALAEGVRIARDAGLLPLGGSDPEWHLLHCDLLSPDQIAQSIHDQAASLSKPPSAITVCGSSGIGKGTAVNALLALSDRYWAWSNGGVFRFIAYLVSQISPDIRPSDGDTFARMVRRIAGSIEFEQPHTVVAKYGKDHLRISDIPAADLASVSVSTLVPDVARHAQGEVVGLANAAHEAQPNGLCMVAEGRKPTLNHLIAESRIELVVRDSEVLGGRRVAQRLRDLLHVEPSLSGEALSDYLVRVYR